MRIKQLEQARHCFAHRDHITLVEVVAQLEVFVDGIGKAALAHFAEKLGQIVDDQAVFVCEELRTHLWNFPARDIGVETVEEG